MKTVKQRSTHVLAVLLSLVLALNSLGLTAFAADISSDPGSETVIDEGTGLSDIETSVEEELPSLEEEGPAFEEELPSLEEDELVLDEDTLLSEEETAAEEDAALIEEALPEDMAGAGVQEAEEDAFSEEPDRVGEFGDEFPLNLTESAAEVVTLIPDRAMVPMQDVVTMTVRNGAIPFVTYESGDYTFTIDPENKGNGTWTFHMPEAAATVHVRYKAEIGESLRDACNAVSLTGGITDRNGVIYAEPGETMQVSATLKAARQALGFSYLDGENVREVLFEKGPDSVNVSGSFTMPGNDVQLDAIRNIVSYIRRQWNGEAVENCPDTREGVREFPSNGSLASDWYIVDKDQTVSSRITVSGEVSLILADGATLKAGNGIQVNSGASLTIYGQAGDSGRIVATGNKNNAGIGGSDGTAGRITIHGGTIEATGGQDSAGIGGGADGDGGIIVILGGTVNATGSHYAAGIGGGNDDGKGGTITIYGGNVTAKGGDDAAGIGGAEDGNGGDVTIYGGTIHVTAGANSAGIGGGENRSGGTTTIHGGNITVYSRDGAAIGGAEDGDGGTINIYDGATLDLHSGNGAGIGGGNHSGNGGTINIYGGSITIHAEHGAGIGGGRAAKKIMGEANSGDGGNITISGGTLNITSDYSFAIGAGGTADEVGVSGTSVGAGGNVRISGGDLTLKGSDLRQFGGIGGDTGWLYMTGGTVKCAENNYSIAFFGKANVEIYGGTLEGRAINTEENVTFKNTNASDPLHVTLHGRAVYDGSIYAGGRITVGDDVMVKEGQTLDGLVNVKAYNRVSALKSHYNIEYVDISACSHEGCSYHITETAHIARCDWCLTDFIEEDHTIEGGLCTVCGYDIGQHIVTFIPDNGENPYSVTVKTDRVVPKPEDPSKSEYEFDNWYQCFGEDMAGDPFNFAHTLVKADITLKARWVSRWMLLQQQIDKAGNGEVITLDRDITATDDDRALVVGTGKTITLDLNGHRINRGETSVSGGDNVITVNGSLTVKDSGGNGSITGGSSKGVIVSAAGTFTLQGGSINGNAGGGVYVENGGTFNLSGNPKVIDNTENGNTVDVCLSDGSRIHVTGPLADSARIGVTTPESYKGSDNPFTSGLGSKGTAAHFYSNDDRFEVGTNSDGEAYLGTAVTVTFDCDNENPAETLKIVSGEKAVRPEDPSKPGFLFTGWYQVTGTDPEALADTEFDFENTAVTEDITLKAVWQETADEAVIIRSANVEFQGKIRLKFTLTFPDAVLADPEAYVSLDKAGITTKMLLSEGIRNENDISFVQAVPAPEYADDIVVKVYSGEDTQLPLLSARGTDYTEKGFDYSVKTYAQNKSATGTSQQMRELAKALDDYGTAAQIYFTYGDYSGLSVDGAVAAVSPDDIAPYALTTSGTKPAGVTGASIAVEFDTDNTLRITFKTDGSRPASDYTFLLDGAETAPAGSGGKAYLQVKNIAAPNLDSPHTFTVTDGTDTYTVRASALSYAYTSAKNGSTERQNIGKALYLYNQAANVYFGS